MGGARRSGPWQACKTCILDPARVFAVAHGEPPTSLSEGEVIKTPRCCLSAMGRELRSPARPWWPHLSTRAHTHAHLRACSWVFASRGGMTMTKWAAGALRRPALGGSACLRRTKLCRRSAPCLPAPSLLFVYRRSLASRDVVHDIHRQDQGGAGWRVWVGGPDCENCARDGRECASGALRAPCCDFPLTCMRCSELRCACGLLTRVRVLCLLLVRRRPLASGLWRRRRHCRWGPK